MMRIARVLLVVLFLFASIPFFACTSIIVSGRASADGRPFIMKTRDATDYNNVFALVKGEKYRYIAVIKSTAKINKPLTAASGYNEKGFAIINTVAHNMNGKVKDQANNTKVLRRALEICATLEDFEHLLDSLPRPMRIDSNYGVMDANGGCAYYETGNSGYVKYDANDPNVAPDGYLVRTNYAFAGDRLLGAGHDRYEAMELLAKQIKDENGKLSYERVIREGSRFLYNGANKEDYSQMPLLRATQKKYLAGVGLIPRIVTTSVMLIQGIKKGESPLQTVAWTIPGNPLTTVAVPLWITKTNSLPSTITRNSKGVVTLVKAGLVLKKRVFRRKPAQQVNISALMNKEGTGILQQLKPVEDKVFAKAQSVVKAVKKNGSAGKEADDFYRWFDVYMAEQYQKRFGIDM